MWFFISLHSAHWMFICTFILLSGRKKQLENVWKHAFSVFVCVYGIHKRTNTCTIQRIAGTWKQGVKFWKVNKSTNNHFDCHMKRFALNDFQQNFWDNVRIVSACVLYVWVYACVCVFCATDKAGFCFAVSFFSPFSTGTRPLLVQTGRRSIH